jgi:hypothetical protein
MGLIVKVPQDIIIFNFQIRNSALIELDLNMLLYSESIINLSPSSKILLLLYFDGFYSESPIKLSEEKFVIDFLEYMETCINKNYNKYFISDNIFFMINRYWYKKEKENRELIDEYVNKLKKREKDKTFFYMVLPIVPSKNLPYSYTTFVSSSLAG